MMVDNSAVIKKIEADLRSLKEQVSLRQFAIRTLEATLAFYQAGGIGSVEDGGENIVLRALENLDTASERQVTIRQRLQWDGGDTSQVKDFIFNHIRKLGYFVGKSDVLDVLRKVGYGGHTSTITHHLRQLCEAKRLFRVQYGDGHQNVFYGLPEWIRQGPFGINYVNDMHAPTPDRQGLLKRTSMTGGDS